MVYELYLKKAEPGAFPLLWEWHYFCQLYASLFIGKNGAKKLQSLLPQSR